MYVLLYPIIEILSTEFAQRQPCFEKYPPFFNFNSKAGNLPPKKGQYWAPLKARGGG
jgi:hypothetical protein